MLAVFKASGLNRNNYPLSPVNAPVAKLALILV